MTEKLVYSGFTLFVFLMGAYLGAFMADKARENDWERGYDAAVIQWETGEDVRGDGFDPFTRLPQDLFNSGPFDPSQDPFQNY